MNMVSPQETPPLRFVDGAHADLPGLHFAPLVDIVFLLICFYLLVAQLVQDQKDLSVELPVMASLVAPDEGPAELVINLRSDGTVRVDGRTIRRSDLRAMLSDQLARARRRRELLRVVIRVDRRQQYGKLDSQVLSACCQAGVRQVAVRCRAPREANR